MVANIWIRKSEFEAKLNFFNISCFFGSFEITTNAESGYVTVKLYFFFLILIYEIIWA